MRLFRSHVHTAEWRSNIVHILCSPYWHKIYKEDSFRKMSQYFRKIIAPKKVKVWILLSATDKGTYSQAWLIPKMNGEVKYSQFTEGVRAITWYHRAQSIPEIHPHQSLPTPEFAPPPCQQTISPRFPDTHSQSPLWPGFPPPRTRISHHRLQGQWIQPSTDTMSHETGNTDRQDRW